MNESAAALMESDIPEPVREELRRICLDRRHPAFLLVGADGCVRLQRGNCGRYGFGSLHPRQPVGDQLDFLAGLLPLDGESLVLPLVQVMPEIYADLHLFPGAEGDWVLFLDATAHAHRLFDIQQNTNELSLLRREQTNLIARIRRGHADMLAILNQLQIITAVVNARGALEFVSDSGSRLLGQPAEAVTGEPWDHALPFTESDKVRVKDLMRQPPDQRRRLGVTLQSPRGQQFAFDLDLRDDPRVPGQFLLYLYDMTEVFDLRRVLGEKAGFHEMVGGSAKMATVFEHVRDIAAVDATVLIEGETGTGKELVANAIHQSSRRKDKPLVVVNAAGLSDSLINSQLFGHKKGAFTDAVSDQEGFFEAANGGTIFLDEIGDIPMNTQTRILRALEQKEVTRIGETRPRKVDVRILAATNKDLNVAVEQGQFRQDLLYRLRVARVNLPPLRDRKEDIPALVAMFLRQASLAAGKTLTDVDQDAMRLLVDYRWPGNVRELKNAIAFAAIHCKGPVLHARDLPPEVLSAPAPGMGRREGDVTQERDRLLRALEMAGGRRGEAARLLGIGRATLYRRMEACLIKPGDLPKHARWTASKG